MASSSRRIQPIVSSSLLENLPHFLKLVLLPDLTKKKLRIPQKFVEQFGHELSEVAMLTVPHGRVWQVALKKKGEKIWFHDGWQDFLGSLSLSAGYFFVFRYGEYSSFHVLIFDLTGCEIDYTNNVVESIDADQNSEFQDNMGNEECVQINERQFEQACEQQNKRKMEDVVEIDKPNTDDESDLLAFLRQRGIYITEKYHLLSPEESKRLINIARAFKPKNPSFVVIWKPCYKPCHEVDVPAMFAEEFVKKDAKYVQVQYSNERAQSVKIWWKHNGGFVLSKGQAEISKVKNLKEGDICMFELVRKQDVLLKLSVFHALQGNLSYRISSSP